MGQVQETTVKTTQLLEPERGHPNDYYRSMKYYHLRRLQDFYAHYDPSEVPNCYKLLKRYEGREGEMFLKLQQKYGPEPAQLNPLENALTFGSAGTLQNMKEEERFLLKMLIEGSARARDREEHRVDVEKRVIALLAQNGIPSANISAVIMESYGDDETKLFNRLQELLPQPIPPPIPRMQYGPSPNVALLRALGVAASVDNMEVPNSFLHRLRLKNSVLREGANFSELQEKSQLAPNFEELPTAISSNDVPAVAVPAVVAADASVERKQTCTGGERHKKKNLMVTFAIPEVQNRPAEMTSNTKV
ncbi:uncharacterized protein TM35_000091760 [Trypanosoma theileri]|uniref:Uncharacterized protein n=1 Tax=Trypanosoma theileri TaxID=67003 RepID=A0A1X0NZL0_9TRYP|nr:uncharacterized protein TM35_000091760 [Trypanosoma theileri]ORC90126.1 hypothetical protein TM35_000091760 [Trypanosoma theileri]